jgi:hypothetical protein
MPRRRRGRRRGLGRNLLSKLDDLALERDAGHQCAASAHIFGFAVALDALIVALDADHRVAALHPCTFLQLQNGAQKSPFAGLFVRLVDAVGLLVRLPHAEFLRHRRVLLLGIGDYLAKRCKSDAIE